jgi:hypothetical protein
MKHCVDPWGDGVPSVALEPFEIASISRQCRVIADLGQRMRLFCQRLFQGEQIREWPGSRLPHGRRRAVVSMLAQERQR